MYVPELWLGSVVGKCMLMFENVSLLAHAMLISLPLYFQAVFVLLPRIVYCVQILQRNCQVKKEWVMSY
jgi:hypothetical protein